MATIQFRTVSGEEDGLRLDRWFKEHYPGLSFGQLQKLMRTGQVRVDGKRVKTNARLMKGQEVRIPPLATDEKSQNAAPKRAMPRADDKDGDFLRSIMLFEDKDIFVFNKPAGLAVQGGSGMSRHVDGMLEALRDRNGQKPRLVHRLDRDTSGVLVVARKRSIAMQLAQAFRERSTQKTYWALVRGVPKPHQARISTYLAKYQAEDGDRMRIARHGDDGAVHAVTHYSVVEQSGQKMSWLVMKPVTGRTHQLRVHSAYMECPIIGDPKYFNIENWEFPGGIQKKLHLHARRIRIPHPKGGILDISAPLPPHMQQSWNLLGFDVSAYDLEIEDELGTED
ncbi:RluA family pseudouridine synthase [uncultured Cohaesibacter sp.]|uniref:RluA family pseudouridine synthase n=1 Tax=uncultured Cohaesibacter sp. TaxID=1002546 RepID=UPI0029302D76|nr:RluA family pseudouridine synthase [uncultured Cohaesibacter sp.]